MNSVNAVGRLTAGPQKLSPRDGRAACTMAIAIPPRHREAEPVCIDVTSFGPLATTCAALLTEGQRVAVTGRLELAEWEDAGGVRHREHSIVADTIEFLDSVAGRIGERRAVE